MNLRVALAAVALILTGCSTSAAPTASPDTVFIDQATVLLGHPPANPKQLISSVKALCTNGSAALTITTANEAATTDDATMETVRAGLKIYCPTLVPAFDAGRA